MALVCGMACVGGHFCLAAPLLKERMASWFEAPAGERWVGLDQVSRGGHLILIRAKAGKRIEPGRHA